MTAEIDAGASVGVGLTVGRMPSPGTPPFGGVRQARLDTADRMIKGAPNTGVVSAAGVAVIPLTGPALGYEWTVRRVTVSDVGSLVNACLGSAWIYAGTTGTVLVPNNAEWSMPTLPNMANWGSDQLVLQYGEILTVQVTGGTAGQVIMASLAYQLYQPGRARARTPE